MKIRKNAPVPTAINPTDALFVDNLYTDKPVLLYRWCTDEKAWIWFPERGLFGVQLIPGKKMFADGELIEGYFEEIEKQPIYTRPQTTIRCRGKCWRNC
jgi:hypothetical protein